MFPDARIDNGNRLNLLKEASLFFNLRWAQLLLALIPLKWGHRCQWAFILHCLDGGGYPIINVDALPAANPPSPSRLWTGTGKAFRAPYPNWGWVVMNKSTHESHHKTEISRKSVIPMYFDHSSKHGNGFELNNTSSSSVSEIWGAGRTSLLRFFAGSAFNILESKIHNSEGGERWQDLR